MSNVSNIILNNYQNFRYERMVLSTMSDKDMQVSEEDLKGIKLKETDTKAQ